MSEVDQSRLTNLQGRLSMLRSDLETRRNQKYDTLMGRITELTAVVTEADAYNQQQFKTLNERLNQLSKDIDRESKSLQEVFEAKSYELESVRGNLQQEIRNMEEQRAEMGRDLIKAFEARSGAAKEEVAQEGFIRNDQCNSRQDIFDQDLPRLKTGMTQEREQTKFQLAEIDNKVKQVMSTLNQMLYQEKQVRVKWQTDLQGMIVEIDKRLNAELLKEKREREAAEKQLVNLLEQATQSYLQFDEDKL
ncbi:hypothetical protein SS50377_22439 [Spironucleus salmonicida]|uniref:Uncharacterized protein n=1 Tax=Spironucleus salmonicida TaxID=348837 RepID=V6LC37_9EUKA|nr:hypothetical protein SS50377_22439 [Spironucleus salmonicida]|eukprot:EST42070.1 hypothetical protein SS50377_18377 [Spironucleus salmonicida]